MMVGSTSWRAAVVISLTMFAWSVPVLAQEAKPNSDQLALDVANAQKANLTALAKYSWRAKTTLVKDNEPMATSVTEMRFNAEGELETTSLGGESNVEKKPGLRGRRQEKAIEDFGQYLEGVLTHAFKYIFISKGTLVDIFDRAKIADAEGGVDVSAGDLFVKGDKLSISLDPGSKLPRKLTFSTTLGEDSIAGVVTFTGIENGPNRPTRLEIEIPTQAVKITSETYDWVAQK